MWVLTALHGYSSVLQREAPSGPPSHLGGPAGVSQLSFPGPGDPQLLLGLEDHLPYGEVLVGVRLCEGAGSSGFGSCMGFGRLWVLPPPGAGGPEGRRANRTPGEQKQGVKASPGWWLCSPGTQAEEGETITSRGSSPTNTFGASPGPATLTHTGQPVGWAWTVWLAALHAD